MFRLMSLPRMAVRGTRSARNATPLSVPTSRELHSTAQQLSRWEQEPDVQNRPKRGGYRSQEGGYKNAPRGYQDIRRQYRDRPEGWRREFFTRPGEEFLPEGQNAPPGFAFLPHGDHFVSRHCRQLAANSDRKVYLVFRDDKNQGTWVPEDILDKVRSDPDALHAKDKAKTMRVLKTRYPKIPEEDAIALHELYYNLFLSPTAKSAKHYHSITTRIYVMNKYTDFKVDAPLGEDREAIGRAHEQVNQILESWMDKPDGKGEQDPARREDQGR